MSVAGQVGLQSGGLDRPGHLFAGQQELRRHVRVAETRRGVGPEAVLPLVAALRR